MFPHLLVWLRIKELSLPRMWVPRPHIFPFPSYAIFNCSLEVYAILEAATSLEHIWDANYVKFFVDSQAALLALAAPNVSSRLVLDTIKKLNSLAQRW